MHGKHSQFMLKIQEKIVEYRKDFKCLKTLTSSNILSYSNIKEHIKYIYRDNGRSLEIEMQIKIMK